MELRKLGRNGPQISVVGYGAWEAGGEGWGGDVPDDQVRDAIRAGIEGGMNWVDTAEAYGDGRSEELVGSVLRDHPDVMVFTKVAPFGTGTKPAEVKRAIRGSLERLGRDHVDLYQVHWPDEENVPVEDTWGAMAELQDEGLVRCIGVSNFDRDLVERCRAIRHVDSVQNQYSLLHQDDRTDLLPWLVEAGIGYLCYGPLAFGLLTGTIDETTEFDENDWRGGNGNESYYRQLFAPGRLEDSLAKVREANSVAGRFGVSLVSLALRAPLEVAGVTGVIAGSRNPKHVRANAEAGDLRLPSKAIEQLDASLPW